MLFEDPRDGSEMRSGVDGQDGALGPLSGCRANEQAGHVVLTRTTACALIIKASQLQSQAIHACNIQAEVGPQILPD